MATPFFAAWDDLSGGWTQVPEAEATHRFDGATYLPIDQAPIAPATPAQPMARPQPQMPGNAVQDLESQARRQAQQVAMVREQALRTAVANLMRLYQGSPHAILRAGAPQVEALMQGADAQRSQVAQQLGPSGGRQINRAQAGVTANMGQQLADLFAKLAQGAQAPLFGVTRGAQGFFPGREATTSTGTAIQEVPPDPRMLAYALGGLGNLGAGIYRTVAPWFATSPGLPPARPDVTAPTRGPFEGYIY